MTSSPTSDNEAGDKEHVRTQSDFTIDHILNRAGNSASERKPLENSDLTVTPFPWLHCTRYCPPKIPRLYKKETPQKRQLGRHPRIPFTSKQLAVLEEKFRQTPYLSSSEVKKVSRTLQLTDMRVKIWFQNRRARERRGRMQLEGQQQNFLNSPTYMSTSPEIRACEASSTVVQETVPRNANTNPLPSTSMVPIIQRCPVGVEYASFRNTTFVLNYSKSGKQNDHSK